MKTKYFEVLYDKNDEPFAQTIANKADKVYEDIIKKLGVDGVIENKKIVLTICESVSRYLEETNKTLEEYKEWMVGNCDFENKKIAILSPKVSTTHTTEGIEKVFVHETIHMIFDIYIGTADTPIWCAEGIAVLYAEQIELNYIDAVECPKISELLEEETFVERGGYDYSGVYVWYFIEKYGFTRFLELYNGTRDMLDLIYEGFEQEAIGKIKERISKE